MKAFLIYPHQLFEQIHTQDADAFFMIEDHLFFSQYLFHKQKIAFHRATMRAFFMRLPEHKTYIDAQDERSKTEQLFGFLSQNGYTSVQLYDPTDYLLERRISRYSNHYQLGVEKLESPNWICSSDHLKSYFKSKKRYFFTSFYIDERKRNGLMLDAVGEPLGGKWTFDTENRKKIPPGTSIPKLTPVAVSEHIKEAIHYTEQMFGSNPGSLQNWHYPIDREQSLVWLDQFIKDRFHHYGEYQDAIVKGEGTLFHAILTPMLNVGLLTPIEIVNKAIQSGLENDIPMNSIEGFVRQIIGWREYIRAVYILRGTEERNKNFFEHTRKMPETFYSGTTGLPPIDDAIARINDSAYTHHIDRLMILGNFMLLCEIDPDEVYKWFMELFIDAYDWVMVTNVYGMSQFADGGIMSTKPYISGSNYVIKMSNYKKGPWCEIWDGLFWRFIDKHRIFFLKNPRLSMMVRTFDKMPALKKEYLLLKAEDFLNSHNSAI